MKPRLFGIFGKVFFYTLLILLLVISVMLVFFADQIKSVVGSTQREQIAEVFQTLIQETKGKSEDDIVRIAQRFHETNASFEFSVMSSDGEVLYRTDRFDMPPPDLRLPDVPEVVRGESFHTTGKFLLSPSASSEKVQFITLLSGDVKLQVSGTISGASIYREFFERTFVAFLLLLAASVAAAFLFAYRIAEPIRNIAGDTRRMSLLESVPPPPAARKDEIGQLANDVYKMYKALKSTIRQLETEVEREKEMEENQRYFFSAASHELKTPIAATSALLEGMLEKVIEPSEYPDTLRECLKMMKEQNKLVSEILEIVALNNHTLVLRKEQVCLARYLAANLPACLSIAEAKKQTVDFDVPEKLSCTIDSKLFGKAFSNIMLNAIQNTPDGGRIRVYANESESGIRLCVLNEGVSISPELLPKLFEPFYREDRSRSREQGRSGLGLALVKKALEFMGIPYALENTVEGVRFRMDLPSLRLDES
ncbi:HAMP domain-containing protein [Paenibacillus antri]|uniref:histidine kinase n=1 Tax=Paenibacillus antri TaxID=2582848 RepID=A0A5R9G3Q3_9BACL|nr:HAMP domain-containing sensor histidine kinase [Paenibacillus antri]TLS48926.1 HAMP domain-containing protein [Paenibacillus antri]